MGILIGILKIISLFFTILYTTVNIMKFIKGEAIPSGNFIFMSAGLTMFIILQFNLI